MKIKKISPKPLKKYRSWEVYIVYGVRMNKKSYNIGLEKKIFWDIFITYNHYFYYYVIFTDFLAAHELLFNRSCGRASSILVDIHSYVSLAGILWYWIITTRK